MKKIILIASSAVVTLLFINGCASIAQMGQAAGVLTPDQAKSLVRSGEAIGKTFQDITPEQEYYIGRAVGATIVNTYKVYNNDEATKYLNVIGQTLGQASDKPETFGGYHFLILDSDEINAFAAPGGFIFVSRGMIRLCKSEDDVAAVLAHEVGHIELAHALKAIKSSRLTSALTILAAEGAKSFGGQDLAQLTEAFEGSIGDITQTMMNSGYARKLEAQADASAITILQRVGYDPNALVKVLTEMKSQLKPDAHDFAATHPDPNDRISDIGNMIKTQPITTANATRQKRFQQALGNI